MWPSGGFPRYSNSTSQTTFTMNGIFVTTAVHMFVLLVYILECDSSPTFSLQLHNF